MSNSLQIDIDTSKAKAALDQLRKTFDTTVASINSFANQGSTAIRKFADAMSALKGIPSNVQTSITGLANTMSQIQTGNINSLANELNKLAKVDVGKVSANVTMLTESLARMRIPPGIAQMATALNSLSNAAKNTSTAVAGLNRAVSPTAQAVSGLGRELLNAGGYMAGFGVSVGNLIDEFAKLRASTGSVSGAISTFAKSLGGVKGSFVAITVGVIAFNALKDAAVATIKPILDVTQQIFAFRNALNAIRGNGTGAEIFEQLKDIASRTGADILQLANNFKQFDASAASAGMSVDKSVAIFEAFAGAMTVLGSSTEQQNRAFVALQQMISKGTVQMEELKGQLSENLPGAIHYFAEALGVSISGLSKMAEQGQIVASEVLPKVAELLNQKYSGALAEALETPAVQMAKLANSVTYLMEAMGNGNIGGIFKGFARGLVELNEALDSEGLRQFARQLGDVLGVAIQAAVSGLGKLINIITTLLDAFFSAANSVGSVLEALGLIEDSASAGADGMKTLSKAVGVLQETFSTLVTGPIIALASMVKILAEGAVAAVNLAKELLGTKVALEAIGNLLSNIPLVGPFIALYQRLPSVNSALDYAASAMRKFRGELEGTETPAKSIARTVENINTQMRDYPRQVLAAADAMNTLKGAQDASARSFSAMDTAIENTNTEMDNHSTAMDDMRTKQQNFTDGIRDQNERLNSQKESIQRAKEAYNELSSSVGKSKDSFDPFKEQLRSIDEEIKRNNRTIKDSERAFKDQMEIEKRYQEDMKRTTEEIKKKKDEMKAYGYAMDDNTLREARLLESLGLEKTAAGEVAKAWELALVPMEKRGEILQGEIENNKKLVESLGRYVDEMNRVTDAEVKKMEKQGYSKEAIDQYKSTQAALTDSTKKYHGELLETLAAQQFGYEVMHNGKGVTEAASEVTKELADKYGLVKDEADIVKDGLKNLATQTGTSTEKTGDLNKANDDSATAMGKSTTKAGELQTKLGDVATKAGEVAASIAKSQETYTTFNTTLTGAATGATTLGEAFASLQVSFPVVQTQLTLINEALPLFNTSLETLNTFLPDVAEKFESLATSFTSISEQMIALNGSMPPFVTSMETLSGMSEPIRALGESFNLTIETIKNAITEVGSIVEKLNELATAGTKVADSFEKIDKSAQPMVTALDKVVQETNKAIERFEKMEEAAKKAFEAAQKANKEGNSSSSGGGSSGASVGAQSAGGYVGEAIHSQFAKLSAFNNAPAFAEGISNTSSLLSKVSGGGIPSILHPNEAVVPLSRGRKIPVDLSMSSLPAPEVTGDTTAIASSINSLTNVLGDAIIKLSQEIASVPPVDVVSTETTPATLPEIKVVVPDIVLPPNSFIKDNERANMSYDENQAPPDGAKTGAQSTSTVKSDGVVSNINITINANDFDSFKRSEDQIARDLGNKIAKANRRIHGR